MVNRVILIGNLGRDPEVRRLENGAAVAKFSIATNESYKDKSGEWQQLTEWHDIVVWRHLAERAERDLKKGMSIYLEGKLTHRKWQDQDGNPRKTTEVVANFFRILTKKEGGGGSSSGYFPSAGDEVHTGRVVEENTPVAEPESEPASVPSVDNGGSTADDLPF